MQEDNKDFFGNGFFDWQFASKDHYKKMYAETPFNVEKYCEHGVYKLSAENQMEISLESNQFVYLKLS
jgi:hypothetical protein